MAVEEPIEYTARLVTHKPIHRIIDAHAWAWHVHRRKADELLKLLEPYLMADKAEEAKYVLSIKPRRIPHTMYRPHYRGYVGRAVRPIFLYEEYVNFPIKYAKVVTRGEILPPPLFRRFALRYTLDGRPVYWHEGMIYK